MGTTESKWKTKDGLDMYSKTWLPAGEARGVVCFVHAGGNISAGIGRTVMHW